ncbi:MAG: hypothetical protein U9N49_02835 [Campylobacterota bacterium]|nr:hypothetical protein [Campylobacterota bacterium]
MELVLQIFPILKVLFLSILIFGSIWGVYQKKWILSGVLIATFVLFIGFNPIVIDSTTDRENKKADKAIEASKTLPKKAEDSSFEKGNQYKGIEDDDIK